MKENDEKDLDIIANRNQFVNALRTTHKAQARGTWYSPKEGSYCAMGLYYYVVKGGKVSWNDCDRALGLSIYDVMKIWRWNDSGSSFAEIADKFEQTNFPICKTNDATAYVLPVGPDLLQQLNELVDATASADDKKRDKEAGRITLVQWFERYGSPATEGFTKRA